MYNAGMGIVQQRDIKRDKALIKDYKKKKKDGTWAYSIKELCFKYARFEGKTLVPITRQRVHQILDFYGVEKTRTVSPDDSE